MLKVITYEGTGNLGDVIQTIALCRLLNRPTVGVRRCDLASAELGEDDTFIVNGWHCIDAECPPPGAAANVVFAGVHTALDNGHGRPQLRWYQESNHPVGCRDQQTSDALSAYDVAVEQVLCPTLMFDRYDGERRHAYMVDYPALADPPVEIAPGPSGTLRLTHNGMSELADLDGDDRLIVTGHTTTDMAQDQDFGALWALAIDKLAAYRSAKLVITGRLHVALPCLAFGTPVLFDCFASDGTFANNPRFSLLRQLGLVPGRVISGFETEPIRDAYARFLHAATGLSIDPCSLEATPRPA